MASHTDTTQAVHDALERMGAVLLDDYVAALFATGAYGTAEDGTKRAVQSEASPLAETGGTSATQGTLRIDSSVRSAADSGSDTLRDPATLLASTASDVHPLSLLPISPSSRLGKRIRTSPTGTVQDAYLFPVSFDQGQCLVQLHEFAQAAGLKLPVFSNHMVGNPQRSSPDHFVTLTFEGYLFRDRLGRTSVKLGKEACARQCLAFFFPEQRPSDDPK
ncbi:unnamed protein product [Parajaminaea phylloscopi]